MQRDSSSLSFIQRVGLGTGQVLLLDYIAAKLLRPAVPDRRKNTSMTSLLSYIARVAALTAVELTVKQQLYRQYRDTAQWLVGRVLGGRPVQQEDDDSSRLERLRTLLMLQGCGDAPQETNDESCPVCFEEACNIRVAGCHHPICADCAKRLCVSQSALSCPMCRGPLEFESARHSHNAADNAPSNGDDDECSLDDLVMLEEWMREAMPTTVMLI